MQVTAKSGFAGKLMMIVERVTTAARTAAGGKGAPWRRTLDASAAHAKSAAAPASGKPNVRSRRSEFAQNMQCA